MLQNGQLIDQAAGKIGSKVDKCDDSFGLGVASTLAMITTRLFPDHVPLAEHLAPSPPPQKALLRPMPELMSLLAPDAGHPAPSPAIMQKVHGLPHPEMTRLLSRQIGAGAVTTDPARTNTGARLRSDPNAALQVYKSMQK